MSIWDSRGRRRAVARRWSPYLGLVAAGAMLLGCLWMLWRAYTQHIVLLPLPNRARNLVLDQEPGFFWAATILYVILAIVAPLAAAAEIDEIRFRRRNRK